MPCWVSHLSALRPERSREQWREYFAWAKETGFTGVRVFAGYLGWATQSASSARSRLGSYLDTATDYGLAVEVTALTGTKDGGYDVDQHVREIAMIIAGRKNVVLELANEYQHGTQDLSHEQLVALGRTYANSLDILWAVGAPATDEPTPEGEYDGAGGLYATSHLDRGRDFWNQCRRVREIFAVVENLRVPCLDNEPLGADEMDGSATGKQRSNDPAFFATLGALDRAFPGVGGVHHSQAGLDAVLPGPVQQECADAYVGAQRAIALVLGGDVPSYRNAGHSGSPVDFLPEGVIRAYSFITGNKGVTVGVGIPRNVDLPWTNGWRLVGEKFSETAWDGKSLVIWEVAR